MDAMTFWRQAKTPVTKAVCERAGIGFEHFKHVAHGRRKLVPDTAVRLASASAELSKTPMTVLALLGLDHLPTKILGTRKPARVCATEAAEGKEAA